MADKSMNVKEMIQAGIDPEDLMEQLQKEIKMAQDEIAEEKKSVKAASDDEIAEARSAVIESCIDYLTLIGVLDEEVSDSDIEELEEVLVKVEKEMEKVKPLFSALKDLEKNVDNDDVIIKAFLKSL
ncbi:MAG: hypothetical protein LIO71_03235 [Ruminococcus sp.]|nr:hypothetical protein [Ruminococcus sp.]